MLGVALVPYHLYFVLTTYGKCAYPCSYVLTVLLLITHVCVTVVAGVLVYLAVDESSQARLIIASAWIGYSVLLGLLTLPIMTKKRIRRCCPTQRSNPHARTVGEEPDDPEPAQPAEP